MAKKYVVRLSDAERLELTAVVRKLVGTSQKVKRAMTLLKADADGPGWTDEKIAEAFSCRTRTIEKLRQRLIEHGFAEALHGKPRAAPPVAKKLNGEQEAQVIALRLGSPPKGFANWSLRLLAQHVVALEIVPAISHETVRRTLKKTG
jgi:hypothetical protein